MASRYGLEIRAATAADAAGLSELLRVVGQPVSPAVLAERLDALRQVPGAALVAVEWGPPSGLVLLHWYRSLDASTPTAQITTLVVDPEARRRGIGRLLVKSASQAARTAGCADLHLQIGLDQPDLRSFADATGFTGGGGIMVRPLRKKA